MLNEQIREAIREAVASEQQPPEVATRIIAWLDELVVGNEEITSPTDYRNRCELCFEAVVVSRLNREPWT